MRVCVFTPWGWGTATVLVWRSEGTCGDGSRLRLYVESRDELRLSGLYLMGHLNGPSTLLIGINKHALLCQWFLEAQTFPHRLAPKELPGPLKSSGSHAGITSSWHGGQFSG